MMAPIVRGLSETIRSREDGMTSLQSLPLYPLEHLQDQPEWAVCSRVSNTNTSADLRHILVEEQDAIPRWGAWRGGDKLLWLCMVIPHATQTLGWFVQTTNPINDTKQTSVAWKAVFHSQRRFGTFVTPSSLLLNPEMYFPNKCHFKLNKTWLLSQYCPPEKG